MKPNYDLPACGPLATMPSVVVFGFAAAARSEEIS
jgi:hypothetical protein